MRITLKQLEIFIATANFENITKAAQSLYLSQSAASMALSELESQLGEPLFDRVGKKLRLNSNGKRLHPKALELIARANEIESLIKNPTGELVGQLNIGASTTIGNYLMPELISRFMKRYPKVKLSLQVSNTKEIISQLCNFSIDLAFIEDSCDLSELHKSIWGEDMLIFFASPKHPLAHKKKLNLADLQNAGWILREQGSGTRSVIEKAMQQHGYTINSLLEMGSTEAIKQLVKKGAGISCLSKSTLINELHDKSLVELSITHITVKRHFYKLYHKEKHQTQLLRAFQNESAAFINSFYRSSK